MKKLHILLPAILLVVILFFIIVNAIQAEPKQKIPTSSWTKAVCNEENYCLDVHITCGDNEVIDIKPTGEGAYFPEDWEDPRPIEMIEKWC